MKGDSRVIELLNEYLQIELTGHKQYLLAAATFERWGLTRLRDAEKAYSHEETDHAAVILHRILLLEGTPNLSDAGAVSAPASTTEQLRRDEALVTRAIVQLRGAVGHAASAGDDGSRALLEHMLVDEEKHLDWLEQQLGLIATLGDKIYSHAQI